MRKLNYTGKICVVLCAILCVGSLSGCGAAMQSLTDGAVAKALARCYHWTIAPCGDTALNMLGLSAQVTAVWSYISDGPYKTYEWDKTKIEFKHRTNKEVTGLSPMTILAIQALKTLGKENVDEKTIRVLSRRLNKMEANGIITLISAIT